MKMIQRKFLFLIGTFVLLALLFNATTEPLVRIVNNKQFRQDEALATRDSIPFLFIGSSRLNKDINEKLIPGAFKYSGATETAPYHYYRLKYALEENGENIEFIILPAEIGVMAFNDLPILYLGSYWRKHMNFWEFARHSAHPDHYIGIGLKIELIPFYQLPNAALFLYDVMRQRNAWKAYQKESWDRYTLYEQFLLLNYIIGRHLSYEKLVTPSGKYYFRKMLELARQSGKPVIFIKYPLSHDYYEAITGLEPDVVAANRLTDSLIRSTKNTYLLDYTHLYDKHDELFLDIHHLNKKGRADFTLRIRDTLQALRKDWHGRSKGNL